jgi:glycosyltransferase involved in cell wall biosynthesis
MRGAALGYLWQYGVFILYSFFALAWRSIRRRYDLVHVHNMPDVLVFSALVPRLLGSKVILDLHDPMPELMTTIFGFEPDSAAVRLLKVLERLSIGFSHRVITVNEACRKIFGSRSCATSKIEVIMNSPDERIFHFQPVPDASSATDRLVIMYHGSIVERHGLDLAVEALALIKPTVPNAELRIYGQTNPFLEQVQEQARRLGLADSVTHFGPMLHEGIARAIDECDVGIIPNRRSIFTEINTPTRIFEYLSRGKPVIAPDAPGITDYFACDQLMFFDLGDAVGLARQLEHVARNAAAVRDTVARGQQVYLNHKWSCERSRLVALVSGLVVPSVARADHRAT